MAHTPTTSAPSDDGPEEGIGLTLSGGGYRAMLYHVGAIVRLHEFGLLSEVKRVSSVSGGSITAGVLALAWDAVATRDALFARVVDPLRALAGRTVDVRATLGGILLPGKASRFVEGSYDKHLFGGATLQDLPDYPLFVINATNLETGALWRFTKFFMGDWKVGRISRPDLRLAAAVTASSAFPPVLSPYMLKVEPDAFDKPALGLGDAFRRKIMLSDGGIYDNYGLEPIYKRYRDVLVSDGGGQLPMNAAPPATWGRHTARVLSVIHAQVHALRSRQLVGDYQSGARRGAFWSIRTPMERFALADPIAVPAEAVAALAQTPTRLSAMDAGLQERLINLGYAQCDAAVRAYYRLGTARGAALPYPDREF